MAKELTPGSRSALHAAIIGVGACAILLASGCVRSQASLYEQHYTAVIAPSDRPAPAVELAFRLKARSDSTIAIAAVSGD